MPLVPQIAPEDLAAKEAAVNPAGPSIVVTIQYLRAVAASLVVYHHAFAPPALQAYYQTHFGEFGVDIFFVISGYIMWATTAKSPRGPVSFWLARIKRIVPIYWLYTTLFIATAIVLGSQALFTPAGLDPLFILKSYLFIPATHPNIPDNVPVYSLGWTLNYEMFFYFVFGLCLLVPKPRVRFVVFGALFLILVLTGYVTQPRQPILLTYTSTLLLEFLAGVALAVLSPSLERLPAGLGVLVALCGVAWLIFGLRSDPQLARILGYGVPASLIVGGGLMVERVARVRPSRIALLLGAASYSIYLAHPFAQRLWFFAARFFFPTIDSIGVVILYVAGGILFGLLGGVTSWLAIERPLLKAGHALIGRRKAPIPRAAPGGTNAKMPAAKL
jgi:exopolysaccharide production protein ExoZ